MYDVAIIGAGINGTAVAFELTQAGKRVALFDKGGIAAGGSGAAGAFISPKFSKSGALKEILHHSFLYSMAFYEKHFPQHFLKSPLLHIAKDEKDDATLLHYKAETPLELLPFKDETRESVSINAGIVNAKQMCEALASEAHLHQEEIRTLKRENGVWILNENYRAEHIVIATGAYEQLLQEPYIKLRGVWGHRVDLKTTTNNPLSLHQEVSISPSNDGVVAVGATHDVHYHPQKTTTPYDYEAGREILLSRASRTISLEDVVIIKDYVGLRSGSFDYMPMVGSLVNAKETLLDNSINFYTKKPDFSAYSYYKNLTMINGSGGYGFVLAPYLAKILSAYILEEKEISSKLLPARFFARYAKRV